MNPDDEQNPGYQGDQPYNSASFHPPAQFTQTQIIHHHEDYADEEMNEEDLANPRSPVAEAVQQGSAQIFHQPDAVLSSNAFEGGDYSLKNDPGWATAIGVQMYPAVRLDPPSLTSPPLEESFPLSHPPPPPQQPYSGPSVDPGSNSEPEPAPDPDPEPVPTQAFAQPKKKMKFRDVREIAREREASFVEQETQGPDDSQSDTERSEWQSTHSFTPSRQSSDVSKNSEDEDDSASDQGQASDEPNGSSATHQRMGMAAYNRPRSMVGLKEPRAKPLVPQEGSNGSQIEEETTKQEPPKAVGKQPRGLPGNSTENWQAPELSSDSDDEVSHQDINRSDHQGYATSSSGEEEKLHRFQHMPFGGKEPKKNLMDGIVNPLQFPEQSEEGFQGRNTLSDSDEVVYEDSQFTQQEQKEKHAAKKKTSASKKSQKSKPKKAAKNGKPQQQKKTAKKETKQGSTVKVSPVSCNRCRKYRGKSNRPCNRKLPSCKHCWTSGKECVYPGDVKEELQENGSNQKSELKGKLQSNGQSKRQRKPKRRLNPDPDGRISKKKDAIRPKMPNKRSRDGRKSKQKGSDTALKVEEVEEESSATNNSKKSTLHRIMNKLESLDQYALFTHDDPFTNDSSLYFSSPCPGSLKNFDDLWENIERGIYSDKEGIVNFSKLREDFNSIFERINAKTEITARKKGTLGCISRSIQAKGERILAEAQQKEENRRANKMHKQIEDEEKAFLHKYIAQNQEPAFQGHWLTKPYPLRQYEKIEEYIPAENLNEQDSTDILELLTSELKTNQFLGQPFSHDNHGIMEDFVKGHVHQTFKDNRNQKEEKEREEAQKKDAIIKPQVQSCLEMLLDLVHERSMNEMEVLLQPPQTLGERIKEQSVWGIDKYTRRNVELSLEADEVQPDKIEEFIQRWLLPGLNKHDPSTAAFMNETLNIMSNSDSTPDWVRKCASSLCRTYEILGRDYFRVHPKGTGLVVTGEPMKSETFINSYLGELYPCWRWCERQDAIDKTHRNLNIKQGLPDFYNILLERPRNDDRGYGLLYVEANRIGNFCSSLSHSCDANCGTFVVSRNGKLAVAVVTLRPIAPGEELTMDYNSTTTEEDEWRAAICLCGTSRCRGSFLHYAGAEDFQEYVEDLCGPAVYFSFILQACELKKNVGLSKKEIDALHFHGLRDATFGKICPNWLKRFAYFCLTMIEHERKSLPDYLLQKYMHEKEENDKELKKQKKKIKSEKELPPPMPEPNYKGIDLTARSVMEQRVQSLVTSLGAIRHVLQMLSEAEKPKEENKQSTKEVEDLLPEKIELNNFPPPIRMLRQDEIIEYLWNNKRSVARSLYKTLKKMKLEPANDISELLDQFPRVKNTVDAKKHLLEIRELLLKWEPDKKHRHNAAADLLLLYANTENYIGIENTNYFDVSSDTIPVYLKDLSGTVPKDKNSDEDSSVSDKKPVNHFERKYGRDYVLAQMLTWYNHGQKTSMPNLYGVVKIPDIRSAYAGEAEYGETQQAELLHVLQHQTLRQKPWPEGLMQAFRHEVLKPNTIELYGSPMLDLALGKYDGVQNVIDELASRLPEDKVPIIASPSPPPKGKQRKRKRKESANPDNKVSGVKELGFLPNNNWVQCEHEKCMKWRLLPWHVDTEMLPPKFYCELNEWNPAEQSCSIPEVGWDHQIDAVAKYDYTIEKYEIGKWLDIYCEQDEKWYPAKIIKVEEDRIKVHFEGWNSRYDKWVQKGLERCAPVFSHTAKSGKLWKRLSSVFGSSEATASQKKIVSPIRMKGDIGQQRNDPSEAVIATQPHSDPDNDLDLQLTISTKKRGRASSKKKKDSVQMSKTKTSQTQKDSSRSSKSKRRTSKKRQEKG